MLRELHVRNFALLEDVRVEFGPGLNVLTGETGAGKSMLVDALGAVLGYRTPSDVVRTGATVARIAAVFDLSRCPRAAQAAVALGVPTEDGILVLVREVGGRARAYANGEPTTVTVLRRLGSLLVEVHGQHEGQRLLDPSTHRELLDAFGRETLGELLGRVRSLFERWHKIRSTLSSLENRERERAHRVDLLTFQVAEIEGANLRPGELEELVALRNRLLHAVRLREAMASAYEALYGGEGAAADQLGRAVGMLRQAAQWDPDLGQVVDALEGVQAQLQETARDVRAGLERLQFDPARLEQVEDRLTVVRGLLRKYGDTEEAVLAYARKAKEELEALRNAESRRELLLAELESVEAELISAVQELSKARAEIARRVEQEVQHHLRDLAMPSARFQVQLQAREDDHGLLIGDRRVAVGPRGADRVEFLLSTNPGEPLKPLARVASGGELSRVMLALRSALATADPAPTMIFDEVDAGVGARTGQVIGAKLSQLARRSQVLCVTHLPQIAAAAQYHLAIRKVTEGGRTRTVVEPLDDGSRVEEVARMLSGPQPTEIARRHARELLRGKFA